MVITSGFKHALCRICLDLADPCDKRGLCLRDASNNNFRISSQSPSPVISIISVSHPSSSYKSNLSDDIGAFDEPVFPV